MGRYRKDVGDWGEGMAVDFLQRRGFRIIERNFHTTQGEIDIVALKGGDYYFVEVKTRLSRALATDLAIHPLKRYRIGKAVKEYCYRRNIFNAGLIIAGIIVLPDKERMTVKIRFAVIR